MSENNKDIINEYGRDPKWIETMTPERQYEWYEYAKRTVLPRLVRMGDDTTELQSAISDYERRNNIS